MLHLSATVGVSVMNLSAKLTQQGGRAPGDSEPIDRSCSWAVAAGAKGVSG